ncbi:MAG: ABC transporter permease [Verrucomicrobiales bacterium]|nr:ABC transporter permease [Verrucomicrobiales bacterium]
MSSPVSTSPPPKSGPRLSGGWRDYLGTLIALAVILVVFGSVTRHFFGAANFRTIANQIPSALLVATGMTYILILGQIDLSVGSVLAFSGAILGVAVDQAHLPLPLAVAAALAAGLACGAFNAFVTLRWSLPSFIVTLGTLEMARGAAHAVTGSRTLYLGSGVEALATAHVLGLSIPFLFAVAVAVVAQLVLTGTIFGRHVVAIGTNPEAARLSGIDVKAVQTAVFVATGFLVALAAVIDTSRFQSANPNAALGIELQAIAAAVIGGTSLMGGRGSVLGTCLGVLVIAALNSGLAAVGAREELKRLVTGAVIIAAVVADLYRRRDKRS